MSDVLTLQDLKDAWDYDKEGHRYQGTFGRCVAISEESWRSIETDFLGMERKIKALEKELYKYKFCCGLIKEKLESSLDYMDDVQH